MTSNEKTLKKRVYAFHAKHFDKADSLFTCKPLSRRKCSSINFVTNLKTERRCQPKDRTALVGRPAKVMSISGIKQFVRLFDYKRGISQRKSFQKYEMH